MSSDDAYSAFLDQANQDTGTSASSGSKSKKSGGELKTMDAEVPAVLMGVERYYTSDADEKFEVVSLRWGGGMPSEGEFCFVTIILLLRAWVEGGGNGGEGDGILMCYLCTILFLHTQFIRRYGYEENISLIYALRLKTSSKTSSATKRKCRA